MPLAYEALQQLATRHQLPHVEEAVSSHMGTEKERRDFVAREVIDEVKPVMDVSVVT